MAERTLVLIKPDAMQRRLAGEILGRLEQRGLTVRAAKLMQVDRDLAGRHYEEHKEKPFFDELVEFITSSPTLALVLEGESAVTVVRTTMGATNPSNAAPACPCTTRDAARCPTSTRWACPWSLSGCPGT